MRQKIEIKTNNKRIEYMSTCWFWISSVF